MSNDKPMYVQFALALRERLRQEGVDLVKDEADEIGLPGNKYFVRVELAPSQNNGKAAGQKLYIPRAVGPVHRIESTLDLKPDMKRGVMDLPKPRNGKPYRNGKIRSHLYPDVEKVAALVLDAVYDGKAPPDRRPAAPASAVKPVPVEGREETTEEQQLGAQ